MKTESQIVKDWMRTMELEDFKKDIKKVNNKFRWQENTYK